MRRRSGQASLEYLGVVAVLAAVAVALVAPAAGAGQLASALVRQIHRALCVVRGGDCEQDRRPCVVGSQAVEDSGYVDLAILHVGSRELVLRERRSDGTVAVTFVRDRSGGLQLGAGAAVRARIGSLRLHAGTELSAALMATFGSGRTWVLPDAATADRLVRRLVVEDLGDLGERIAHAGPDLDGLPRVATTFGRSGFGITLGAAVGQGANGGLRLSSEDLEGESTDVATRARTYLVRRRNSLVGALSTGGRERASGSAGADEAYTVTVDRSGRPLDLGVLTGRDLQGTLELPGPLRRIAAGAIGATSGARRWEAEQHLDLTDAGNLAAAAGFLRQVVSPSPRLGGLASASEALRARLDRAGVLDARVYAVDDGSSGVEAGGQLGGATLGSGYVRRRERGRLVAAVQRGPDGLWRARWECLEQAV